jgi:BirA family biotin operon repressor/biotin-[acetyl-CoA-carboxylase] ligase
VLRENILPAEAFQWSFVAGLAVRDVVGGDLKWPNDVVVDRQKVAGILCTLELSPTPAVIVGIGLNLGFDPTEVDPTLRAAALTPADHASTLASLLLALEHRSDRHPAHTLTDYRSHLALVGETVSVTTQTSKITGTLEGMSDTFELIIQSEGARHLIASADVWPLG